VSVLSVALTHLTSYQLVAQQCLLIVATKTVFFCRGCLTISIQITSF
jgi:hypothetical protein